MPKGADTRDTEAIKRVTTAYLKLLFPNVKTSSDISARDFKKYCLKPAMEMRQIIRMQMGFADVKYQGTVVPELTIKEIEEE